MSSLEKCLLRPFAHFLIRLSSWCLFFQNMFFLCLFAIAFQNIFPVFWGGVRDMADLISASRNLWDHYIYNILIISVVIIKSIQTITYISTCVLIITFEYTLSEFMFVVTWAILNWDVYYFLPSLLCFYQLLYKLLRVFLCIFQCFITQHIHFYLLSFCIGL